MRDCHDRNLGGWTSGVVRRSRPIVRTSAHRANVRRKVCLGSKGDLGSPVRHVRSSARNGKLLRPTGLKTEAVQISMRPGSGMNEERRKDYNSIGLGALDL
jgi:hypothetical protein